MTALAAALQPRGVAADPTLADFGHDPWWLIVIKVLFVFLFLLLGTLITIWAERRVLGYMQNELDGRVRDRAVRLVRVVAVLPSGGSPVVRPGDQL
jgi:hypothetical protein